MSTTQGAELVALHVEPSKTPKHRHERSSWLIAGGHVEWCYQCGAFRPLKFASGKLGTVPGPEGKWQKPTGLGGPNPAMTR